MTVQISAEFSGLQGHSFIALTTYRKTGVPVVTPVWFVLQEDGVLVFTGRTSGKVKRLRNNPQVELSPSDFRGKPLGPAVSGRASFLLEDEWPAYERTFRKRYGAQFALFGFIGRVMGDADRVYLKITPT
jgi:PPOX class probable F420-dependent enzyme